MASPQFNSFDLQNSVFVVENVEYRTIPVRDIVLENIARKPGKKILSTEFAERHIKLAGWILGDSATDLIDQIDNLHNNVTRKVSGTLTIDSGREIEAIVASVTVPEPHYTQSMVPFEIEFIAAEPFWRGQQQTVTLTVASGTSEPQTITTTITISGTVFAEPTITYNAPAGSGYTTTSGIIVSYDATGETLTWSGTSNSSLAYSNFVKFDYDNQLVLEGSVQVDHAGVFSRWEPGSTNFTTTFSGRALGGSLDFAYRPRYL